MTQKVAAVVVAFNRVGKLEKVLKSLETQTHKPDRIYVIDNASTDNTREFMENHKADNIHYMRLPKNVGGAGGFNVGIKAAFADGFDLFWLSDDDAYPNEDAIEKLANGLSHFEEISGYRPSFACSAVRFTDGSWCEMNTPATVWDWPRFYSKETPYFLVQTCSFVSVMIPRWAIKEHGFPIKDYFIWFDDAEYTRRLAKSYPGIFVPDSLVTHDAGVNQGVNYGLISDQNLWKYRYGTRNETSFRLREQGYVGVLAYTYMVRQQMRDGRQPLKRRLRIYLSIWRGIWFKPRIEHARTPQ